MPTLKLPVLVLLFLPLTRYANAQVVTLGSPFLSGCSPAGSGGLAPAISALGEPTIGNTGFGILGDNLLFLYSSGTGGFNPILLLGVCATSPIPSSSFGFPTCPPQPGGCFSYVDIGFPLASVSGVSGYIPPQLPLTGSGLQAASQRAAWSLPIGSFPSIVGSTVCAQVFFQPQVVFGAPPACIRVSNGLQITVLP